ncbi:alpha/beta hydrolase fold domain-containing protein [Trichoderma breve]|uniref:Alpha/beta hydrolase fold domain-containing protein n=1 Tax=Trichoderma breve TaxID=2034170 RepID=A0A9W9BKM9_9HYPO|nr:alpha/beta hydrolase fold domain-containing protein [Trichoderma breve]KAJ4861613.1 alpha/beta hydrolase fold domain-containing protein [Trichoderma breve]
MNRLNTTSVSLAVTPTVVSTLFSHYLNKKNLKEHPTTHLSYDEGLHLIRSFLEYASQHTVEEIQGFTGQWVPHPQWVKLESVTIPDEHLGRAAELIEGELGPDGIRQVGGRKWWHWRGPKGPLEAEWIEMRADANERKKNNEPLRRVMLYLQRHARKLKARVFAPRTIIFAGDSAGGGMVTSMLCLLRDQGIPLPAGGILISPWVDLTHSFPSVALETPLDYIPQSGFHHKPSRAWPPPNDDDVRMLKEEADKRKKSDKKRAPSTAELEQKQQDPVVPIVDGETGVHIDSAGVHTETEKFLTVTIDGELITMKDQIQMYTTNALLSHPLVSPVKQPTLGGLPPLLITVGGGELLRDEQIYLAHKRLLAKYKPTYVQLQVWDDLCHVAPTLSFTSPAKYMYRSIAQFGAWALARAQNRDIEIMDDDAISVITSSGSDTEAGGQEEQDQNKDKEPADELTPSEVGRAGDPLPPFKNYMIRQRIARNGAILPLPLETDLPGCNMKPEEIGIIKEGPVRKWLETKGTWDHKYASAKAKTHKKIIKEMIVGYKDFGPDERPPPTALAGRIPLGTELQPGKRRKSFGLAIWSLWGSKHDEMTVEREQKANYEPEMQAVTPELTNEVPLDSGGDKRGHSRRPSRQRIVRDEHQTGSEETEGETVVEQLIAMRREQEAAHDGLLSPDYSPDTGVAGKRPFLDGIALPFSIKNDAETASMITLNSAMTPGSRPMSPSPGPAFVGVTDSKAELVEEKPTANGVAEDNEKVEAERPGIETFVTAQEDLPQVKIET